MCSSGQCRFIYENCEIISALDSNLEILFWHFSAKLALKDQIKRKWNSFRMCGHLVRSPSYGFPFKTNSSLSPLDTLLKITIIFLHILPLINPTDSLAWILLSIIIVFLWSVSVICTTLVLLLSLLSSSSVLSLCYLTVTLCCRMDPKRSENMELRNGNAYPTLPLLEKPQAPSFLDSP